MNNWSEIVLKDICDITRGASPRPIHDFMTEDLDGIPWVKISDATASNTRFIENTKGFIKKEGKNKSVSVISGDLIVSNSATPGLPKIMGIDACIHDGWLLLRNLNGVCKEFLFYLLTNDRKQIVSQGTGTVFTNLKTDILKNHQIKLPPISEQEEIASFLGSVDDKIELTQKMNETLEEIAKTLFKSWFIDFDPVRAKAEGRPTGVSKEISDLFPDSFEDSELGEIPKGWNIEKLGNQINLTKGRSYKSAELKESHTALVSLKSFQRNGGYREDGLKEYIGAYKDDQVVIDGDLIVAFTDVTQAADVIGKPAIVIGNPKYSKLVISLDVGVIRVVPKSLLSNSFIYYLMLSNRYASNSLGYTNGTNVLHLKKEAITDYYFCLPKKEILEQYNETSSNILEKISINSLENKALEDLRDTLLPKLISGELKIPDAEEINEEAGI